MNERKLKIVYVDDRFIIDVLNVSSNATYEYITVPKITYIPKDAVVENVFYDNSRACWGVVISHDSFEVVIEGEMIPSLYCPEWTDVQIKKVDE